MSKALKRSFEKGQKVYVVDYWGKAFGVCAKIVEVQKETQIFRALLYGKTYSKYSFKDYGTLIFDTLEEVQKAAERVPKPRTAIYHLTNSGQICKKVVVAVDGQIIDGTYNLIIHLNRGKSALIEEIGESLFVNEYDARMRSKKAT